MRSPPRRVIAPDYTPAPRSSADDDLNRAGHAAEVGLPGLLGDAALPENARNVAVLHVDREADPAMQTRNSAPPLATKPAWRVSTLSPAFGERRGLLIAVRPEAGGDVRADAAWLPSRKR